MKVDSAIFYTNNLQNTVDFYTNKLGLKLEYISAGKYASFLFEGGVCLGIKQKIEERELPGHQTLLVVAENIESKFEEIKKSGVEFYKELKYDPWGSSFSVLDPDGNKFEFIKRKN